MAQLSSLEVLQKVAQVAEQAGLRGKLDEENNRFYLGVSLQSGRVQGVLVRDNTGESQVPIISVFSPCLVVKSEKLQKQLPEMAIELLRANERINFASFGLYENEDESLIVASYELLLNDLAPQDLRAGVFSVAMAADMYEERFGKDEF